MTLRVRSLLFGTVACAFTVASVAMALAAPAAQAAGFGVERFVAANCIAGHEDCAEELFDGAYPLPKEPTKPEAEAVGYTQAAGHPPYGITAFKVDTVGAFPNAVPTGIVTHVRTDVAPGVSTNPTAVPLCSTKEFGEAVAPGFYPEPKCPAGSVIGKNKVVVVVEPAKGVFEDVPIEGTVYNVVQPKGVASLFGVALPLESIGFPGVFAHTLIEGHVEWGAESKGTGKADYHDYYEINVSPTLPLISSILILDGNIGGEGHGGFITNPSTCAGPGTHTTNTVTLESSAGETAPPRTFTTPIGTEGCFGGTSLTVPPFELKSPPFEPTFSVKPATTQSDQPDGITTELAVPHDPSPTNILLATEERNDHSAGRHDAQPVGCHRPEDLCTGSDQRWHDCACLLSSRI